MPDDYRLWAFFGKDAGWEIGHCFIPSKCWFRALWMSKGQDRASSLVGSFVRRVWSLGQFGEVLPAEPDKWNFDSRGAATNSAHEQFWPHPT